MSNEKAREKEREGERSVTVGHDLTCRRHYVVVYHPPFTPAVGIHVLDRSGSDGLLKVRPSGIVG